MFWLIVGIVSIIAVTFLGVRDGFEKWSHYYVFGVFAILLYLIRRFMMKRMIKHQEFLNQKKKEGK